MHFFVYMHFFTVHAFPCAPACFYNFISCCYLWFLISMSDDCFKYNVMFPINHWCNYSQGNCEDCTPTGWSTILHGTSILYVWSIPTFYILDWRSVGRVGDLYVARDPWAGVAGRACWRQQQPHAVQVKEALGDWLRARECLAPATITQNNVHSCERSAQCRQ